MHPHSLINISRISDGGEKADEVEQRLEHHSEIEDHLTPEKQQETNDNQAVEEPAKPIDDQEAAEVYALPEEDQN